MKKIFAMVLAVLSAALLASCGTLTEERVSTATMPAVRETEEALDPYWDSLPDKESFDPIVKNCLEAGYHPGSLGFLMYDLNMDGADDLLIGRDGYILDAYAVSDGQLQQLVDSTVMPNCFAYLCQGNVLAKVSPQGSPQAVSFYQIENGELIWLYTLRHNLGPDESWMLGDPETPFQMWEGGRAITEEAYHSTRNSHTRIPMAFRPLSEYPLAQPIHRREGSGLYAPGYQDFAGVIESRVEEMSHWKPEHEMVYAYDLLDLDGDGQQELYLDRGSEKDIYTMVNRKVELLYPLHDDVLCENGILREHRPLSGDNAAYIFHKISGDTLTPVEYLRYDADVNPDNPWLRSADATGQDMTMEPISLAEFQSILERYRPMELDLKPLEEFSAQ